MNRSFETPNRLPLTGEALRQWAATRETDTVVAAAIHAIVGRDRDANTIWANPTGVEIQNVAMAVDEYLRHGDFKPSDDGTYQWGNETITLD